MSGSETSVLTEQAALAEYAAAQTAYLHYDSFPWQVGGVIVVGAFAFWGFVVEREQISAELMLAASVLVTLIMSTWLLRFAHNRQIYIYHIHRMHELEALLGMSNHLRFKQGVYKIHAPRGHQLNYVLFAIVSVGAPILYALQTANPVPLFVNLGIIILVVTWAELLAVRTRLITAAIPPPTMTVVRS